MQRNTIKVKQERGGLIVIPLHSISHVSESYYSRASIWLNNSIHPIETVHSIHDIEDMINACTEELKR